MIRMRESVLALLLWLPVAAIAADQVTPVQLQAMQQSTQAPLVLDVRTDQEFADGHVPGAVLIPYDQLSERLGELDRSREIVAYCRTGRRSTIAEELLLKNGFKVRQMAGSWQAWQAAGLPVETAAKAAPASEKTP